MADVIVDSLPFDSICYACLFLFVLFFFLLCFWGEGLHSCSFRLALPFCGNRNVLACGVDSY